MLKFEQVWKKRVAGLETASDFATLSRLLLEEKPFVIVDEWSVSKLLKVTLPFPDATSAADLARHRLKVPFWHLFIACGLPEQLATQLAGLPQEERAAVSRQTLSEILQCILVPPFGDKPCADRLAAAMLSWEAHRNVEALRIDGLPPQLLCLELLHILCHDWEPTAARIQAEIFAGEAAFLQAQFNQQQFEVPKAFREPQLKDPNLSSAPSSSAESVDHADPTRDTYLILTMALDRQRVSIDLGQQILNLSYFERKLREFAASRELERRKWQALMLGGWRAKVVKEMDRIDQQLNEPSEPPIEERRRTMELEILESMDRVKVDKDMVIARREKLKARQAELEAELIKVKDEIEELTEREVRLAEALCHANTSLEARHTDLTREAKAAERRAAVLTSMARDLRALMDAQPDSLEDHLPARDVDSMPETCPCPADHDESFATPRAANLSPPSVSTERTGAATCGDGGATAAPEVQQRITHVVERLLEEQLPAFMSTERTFVQFCCDKLRSIGDRARNPPKRKTTNLDVQRWQLYRPLLAQTVLTIDRLTRSTELSLSVLFPDQSELAKIEPSKDVFLKVYLECKQLIADNHTIIF